MFHTHFFRIRLAERKSMSNPCATSCERTTSSPLLSRPRAQAKTRSMTIMAYGCTVFGRHPKLKRCSTSSTVTVIRNLLQHSRKSWIRNVPMPFTYMHSRERYRCCWFARPSSEVCRFSLRTTRQPFRVNAATCGFATKRYAMASSMFSGARAAMRKVSACHAGQAAF